VLIEGEAGSGKGLVAAALRQFSDRRHAPLRVFNCAAMPAETEAALFGQAKGAYTNGQAAATDYFEDAGNGTLVLEEVGALSLAVQAKLLRVLEHGEYQRMGETATRTNRARIIATTSRALRDEVYAGRFLNELHHRLGVFTIQVPPLRKLKADKLLLLQHFRKVCTTQNRQAPFELDAAALRRWEHYRFPGNTRELRNIVMRLAARYSGKLVNSAQLEAELEHMPDPAEVAGFFPQYAEALQ
jgi:DNA-binding NtrC family response regulator